MTSHLGESKETEALTGLVELARTSVPPAAPAQMALGYDLVMARLEARENRRGKLFRSSLVLATGAVCVMLVWGTVSMVRARMQPTEQASLSYSVEGGSVIEGGYLRESASTGVKLAFNEGSEFTLMPGARGRLRAVDSSGARIAIEQGSASFRITPRKHANWQVDVGPFLVTVKGTAFSVHWDPTGERFELRLQHGRVAVSGPVSGGEIALRAGQRLLVNLPKAETLITEQKPGESWVEPSPAAAGTPDGSAPSLPRVSNERPAGRSVSSFRPDTTRSDSTKSEGGHRWAEAIAAGQWDRVLSEAEQAGIKPTLNNASSEDLFALADAARYRRQDALARQALLAERRRFPDSPRALDATFLLGRLEEANEQGTGRALRWYDEYLARAPAGTYASEALGRKMMVTKNRDGANHALPIAEEYLRRFPGGTYAGAAQALRRSP
jgi:ferric-dicitrate binding protein FerR (iron transport regulator)